MTLSLLWDDCDWVVLPPVVKSLPRSGFALEEMRGQGGGQGYRADHSLGPKAFAVESDVRPKLMSHGATLLPHWP